MMKKLFAVIRCLEIIGEAANRIPKDIQDTNKDIIWEEIIGMRNILIHYYYGADDEVIWKTIKQDIPKLYKNISVLKKNLGLI